MFASVVQSPPIAKAFRERTTRARGWPNWNRVAESHSIFMRPMHLLDSRETGMSIPTNEQTKAGARHGCQKHNGSPCNIRIALRSKKMKQTISFFIEIGLIGTLLSPVFLCMLEEGALANSIRPVQSERDTAPEPSSLLNPLNNGEEPSQVDNNLHLKNGARRAPRPARKVQALQFHRNTLLNRFQNADSHGQMLLTFSRNRIDLHIRNISGAEAPIAGMAFLFKEFVP